MPRVRVVDDSPATAIGLTGRTALAIGVGETWLEGARVVAAPQTFSKFADKRKSEPKDEVAVQYDLHGEVLHVHKAGSLLVEIAGNGQRELWWCDEDGPRHVHDADYSSEVEVLGNGTAAIVAGRKIVIVRAAGPTTTIELPPQIETHRDSRPKRRVAAVPPQNTLVIIGKMRASLLPIDALVAARDKIEWEFDWIYTNADPDLRVNGVVTMSKWGRTNILIGERKIQIGATPLVENEQVELRGLLWDRLASTMYREIVRGDGSVISYPGVPDTSPATTAVTTL